MSDPIDDPAMLLRIWGARGSLPSSPDACSRYGDATSCAEIEAAGHHLIFDAGSGIVALGYKLLAGQARKIDLFFSHVHYDHIIGLPYFKPLYYSDFRIRIHFGSASEPIRDLIGSMMREPFFPISSDCFRAEVEYVDFKPGETLQPAPGIAISTHPLVHPGGAVAYRVEHKGQSLVYATDHEHMPAARDPALEDFIRGSAILVYDTTYCDAEMATFAGWGHSSWEEGVRLCRAGNVPRLVLFHHAHTRCDRDIARMEAEAQAKLPGAVAGRPGLEMAAPRIRRPDLGKAMP